MSFSWLPAAAVGIGLAALAALLYALQRLRVRHREVVVPTTLFWKEAAEETRARELVRRFRHPWAYLFVLAIAAALWLAAAGPRAAAGGARRAHVFLLDASAGMARPGRFAKAVAILRREVDKLPDGEAEVVFCGARPRTLLRRGEHALLLERRLEGLAPEACPPTVARFAREVLARAERPTTLVVVGDAPAPPELETGVAAAGAAKVVRPALPPRAGVNGGVVALGASPAASGAWDRVDVFARADAPFAATLDGAALDAPVALADGGVVWRDVPAAGGRFVLRRVSADDALALDDEAALALPLRPPVRVAVAEGLPRVRAALAADPGVALVASGADVVVGTGAAADLSFADGGAHAFSVTGGGVGVREALLALGLEDVDATALATVAARPVSLAVAPGPRRRVVVWRELLSDRYDFTHGPAFPLFLARTVRWLAGPHPFVPYVAAGTPVPGDGPKDLAGRPAVPARAGDHGAALLSPHATARDAPRGGDGLPAGAGGARAPWFWLGLAAFLGLLVEWGLVGRGRMP